MSFREKDFITRLTEAIGRTLARALGLAQQGKEEEALDVLERESGDVFGIPKSVLDALDAQSAARMLREAAKIKAYAQVLRAEAQIRGATSLEERARQLESLAT